MKSLIRSYLINLGALWATTQLLPGLEVVGGTRELLLAALVLMLSSYLLVPILKIVLLPLNLLTLGFFAWLSNVLALYILVSFIPTLRLVPYYFQGIEIGGLTISASELTTLQVAVVAAVMLSFIIHFLKWLVK